MCRGRQYHRHHHHGRRVPAPVFAHSCRREVECRTRLHGGAGGHDSDYSSTAARCWVQELNTDTQTNTQLDIIRIIIIQDLYSAMELVATEALMYARLLSAEGIKH